MTRPVTIAAGDSSDDLLGGLSMSCDFDIEGPLADNELRHVKRPSLCVHAHLA
jgi:hypothetical protein